ncbi:MFS transporter [Gordonia terrae]|uniref:MFS transporter n=2 Tax=Gordonia terrae TaxID=2055 RepID=A0AAD0NX82_9ACTN|nr:MFS transporter [Gordonia terrae]ANY22204.1 transporter [Gordonia terrae]AWO82945.1 MFS transporter [Gordonia terrae]GAB46329.1 putative major facilitator superfamily transporter [Gordonia terrae NBRC 100016]VTS29652.1 Spectinomycin tetracycline efflux pump [Gordonia terrae]
MSESRGGGGDASKTMFGVVVLCVAGIAMSLTQTLIVPLIPMLPVMLGTTASNASWAVTVTMAVGAVATPIAGRVADMVGKRRVLLFCVGGVAVGSLVCAVAPGLTVFLVGRALQGLGVAFVAVGISIMRDFVPAHRLGTAVGMMSSSLAVGGALGLPFSAFVAQTFGWRELFWISVAGSVACFVGIVALIKVIGNRTGGRFDLFGAIGLSVILLTLLLPLSKGPEWGWTSSLTLSMFGLSAATFVVWVNYERRKRNPLLDLRIATLRAVMLGNVIGLMNAFAFYGMELVPIQMLMAPASTENGLGVSMLSAGLLMAPTGLAAFVSSNVGARLGRSLGVRVTLVIASLIAIVGLCALLVALLVGWAFPIVFLVVITCLIGTSTGMSYATLPTLIMEATPVEQTGEANGLNALMRIVGLAAAAAVTGMILANNVTEVAGGDMTAPSTAGFTWAVVVSLGAVVVSVVAALCLPRSARTAEPRHA